MQILEVMIDEMSPESSTKKKRENRKDIKIGGSVFPD